MRTFSRKQAHVFGKTSGRFYSKVRLAFQNRNHDALEKYVSTEKYIQRNPNIPSGIEVVKHFLATQDFNDVFILKATEQGDHVVSYGKSTFNRQELEMGVFEKY